MFNLSDDTFNDVKQLLSRYDYSSSVDLVAGLLTIPSLDVYEARISTFVHLLIGCARGKKKLFRAGIDSILNDHIVKATGQNEDPNEEVFVANIETNCGNYSVFLGIVESSDYMLQTIIDALSEPDVLLACKSIMDNSIVLLKLCNEIVKRNGLANWTGVPVVPDGHIKLPNSAKMRQHAEAVLFSQDQLSELGVYPADLSPFVMPEDQYDSVAEENIGGSTLERYPLVRINDKYIFILPQATCISVIRYTLESIRNLGFLNQFILAIVQKQIDDLQDELRYAFASDSQLLESKYDEDYSVISWLIKFDICSYLNVIYVHNMKPDTVNMNYSLPIEFDKTRQDTLEKCAEAITQVCSIDDHHKYGITFVVMGGIGPGYFLSLPKLGSSWSVTGITIRDLLLMLKESKNELFYYMKCMRQKDWYLMKGVSLLDPFGDFYTFCYWKQINYSLLPAEAVIDNSTNILIPFDFVLPYRQRIMSSVNQHVVQSTSGSFIQILRYGKDAFFESIRSMPMYVPTKITDKTKIQGVIDTKRGSTWLIGKARRNDKWNFQITYDLWRGVFEFLHKLAVEVEKSLCITNADPISVFLDFSQLFNPDKYKDSDSLPLPTIREIKRERNSEVEFPEYYLNHFRVAENTGERNILTYVAMAILKAHGIDDNSAHTVMIDGIINTIIPETGARFLHLFQTYNPIDILVSRKKVDPIFISDPDFQISKILLADIYGGDRGIVIEDKQDCLDYLKGFVDSIWSEIKRNLRKFDRKDLVSKSLDYIERVYIDRTHWKRTAQALLSLYHSDDDVYKIENNREGMRASVSISARTVIEMAICESPLCGEKVAKWELDELLAKVAVLILNANQSDAIHYDYIEPIIEVFNNGDHSIETDFYNDILRPFTSRIRFEDFHTAAKQYGIQYSLTRNDVNSSWSPSAAFSDAFYQEYDIRPQTVFECVAELIDIAFEHGDNIVLSTIPELSMKIERNRGISKEHIRRFFSKFTLYPRPSWNNVPDGYMERDFFPWRYSRRLSLIAKPIICIDSMDESVVYGTYTVSNCITDHINRSENGRLPQTFFRTQAMKSYLGDVNRSKGDDFEIETANILESNGWKARVDLPMTEIGGTDSQGNIDVIAWDNDEKVLIIECKRLQLARSISEVADVCDRFKGEAGDQLDKHMSRVRWINENPSSLCAIVGFHPKQETIEDYLVTSVPVPMKYISNLPIDNDRIIQLDFFSGT
ncbi:MAG: hypothetical protein ACTSYJ_02420 [Candidatus Thorarchaeota archaeon]